MKRTGCGKGGFPASRIEVRIVADAKSNLAKSGIQCGCDFFVSAGEVNCGESGMFHSNRYFNEFHFPLNSIINSSICGASEKMLFQ